MISALVVSLGPAGVAAPCRQRNGTNMTCRCQMRTMVRPKAGGIGEQLRPYGLAPSKLSAHTSGRYARL